MRRRRVQAVYRKQQECFPAVNPGKVVPILVSGGGTVPSAGNPPLLLYPDVLRGHTVPSRLFRRHIRLITELNALLTGGISLLTYGIVVCEDGGTRNILKGCIGVLSLGQMGLIVLYWCRLRKWLESLRQELRLSSIPISPLQYSQSALCSCLLECSLHLLVPPPLYTLTWKVHMLGSYSFFTLDDFLYVLILLRNYHFFRYLAWSSELTTRRACMCARLTGVQVTNVGFGVRYGLAVYPFRLIIGLYILVMLISGLSIHILETARPGSDFDSVYNGIWIVANTQATIGYGEFTPKTYFGCIVLIISCFVGTFTLSLIVALSSRSLSLTLAESSLYTALAYGEFKRKYRREAALLIQRWWRLMGMRLHHTISGTVILNYYGESGRYKKVLQAGEQTKDRRFEGQVEAFQVHIARECRYMTEYLQPILDAEALVRFKQITDLLRAQYQIQEKCRSLCKFSHRLVVKSYPNLPSSGFVSTRHGVLVGENRLALPHNDREMAIAKVKARQRLLGRLLKESSGSRTPQSERSKLS